MAIDFGAQRRGERALLDIGDAQLGGDREPGRDGQAQVGHFGEPGALAAQDIAHRRRTISAAVAEEVDVAFNGHTVKLEALPLHGHSHL